MTTQLASEAETRRWGGELALNLQAGDVIALCGNLGAGKTQVVKGMAQGLGSAADVTSPTFTLVHEYTDGRLPLYHFDFYRIDKAAELLGLGWDEYLAEPGVVVVEWADRFPELMPASARWFRLETTGEGSRAVTEGAAP